MQVESRKSQKTLTIPKYLFRYLRDDENLLATLTTPYLWFSAPETLNDPFDLTNVLTATSSDEDLEWYFYKYAAKIIDATIEKNFKELLANKEGKRKFLESIELAQSALHKIYIDSIGLCCFSFLADSPLMWSHYSGGHTGACMVIDTKNFVSEFSLIKVNYKKELPKWNMIETRKRYGASMEYNLKFDQVVLGTKYLEWKYEKEYRLISRCQGLHNLYPSAIVGVIFGARMSEKRRLEIKEKIQSAHTHITIENALLEPSSGSVSIHNFENRNDTLPFLGWRHLTDPEGQFRDQDGTPITK